MLQNYSKAYSDNDMVQVFTGPVTNAVISRDWKIWNKPKNASLIYIFIMGGGAGGSGGGAQAVNATAGGGGGGGPAGYSHLLYPAFFVPDVLYIQPGYGGLGGTGQVFGGAAGTNGLTGGHSFISTYPAINSGKTDGLGYDVYLGVGLGGTAGTAGSTAAGSAGNGYTEPRRDTVRCTNMAMMWGEE